MLRTVEKLLSEDRDELYHREVVGREHLAHTPTTHPPHGRTQPSAADVPVDWMLRV